VGAGALANILFEAFGSKAYLPAPKPNPTKGGNCFEQNLPFKRGVGAGALGNILFGAVGSKATFQPPSLTPQKGQLF